MNKPLILLLFVLAFQNSNAQHAYIPIPDDSAIWVYLEVNKGNDKALTYYGQWTAGLDTVLNGTSYFVFFGDWPYLNMPMPAPKNTPKKAGIWLRQDTVAKKVYLDYYNAIPADDHVLYDFSLKKGDTVLDSSSVWFAPQSLYPHKAWVSDLDSVYWSDAKWHYRWTIKCVDAFGLDTMQAIMIEGMGFTTHFYDDPFYKWTFGHSWYWKIGCFGVKGQWLYSIGNSWNADCDTMLARNVVTSVEELSNDLSQPILFPNPVSSNGILNFNSYSWLHTDLYSITVYDLLGRMKINLNIRPGQQIPLSNFSLGSGIYFAIIKDKQQKPVYSGKLIIE